MTSNGNGAIGATDVLELVLDARDVCHTRAEDGLPIVVPDPGTEHGRRLLHTLGAHVTVEMTLDEYVALLDRANGQAAAYKPLEPGV